MRWPPNILILALAAGAGLAHGEDPLKSSECTEALGALQAQEAVLLSSRAARDSGARAAERATLESYRTRARRECLGKEEPAVARTPRTPVVVAPVTLPPSAVPAPPTPLPAPVGTAPPRTVTQCDPSGCWTSDGMRLNRLGPLLLGPPGACTVQSGVLSCR